MVQDQKKGGTSFPSKIQPASARTISMPATQRLGYFWIGYATTRIVLVSGVGFAHICRAESEFIVCEGLQPIDHDHKVGQSSGTRAGGFVHGDSTSASWNH
jgi:hypothetical protein